MRADQVTGPVAHHAEGPLWDRATGRLLWVDMLRGDLLAMVPGGEVERRHVGSVAACVAPRVAGGYVVATERGFMLMDSSGGVEVLADVWDDVSVRMNDGGCDPDGRFYCGSMAYDATAGRGALYRLDPDRTVHTVLTGATISNGLDWSADRSTVFYVDTPTRRIDAFGAGFTDRRTLVEIPAEAGMPDGLTVDADGGIWVALWGGGAVHRYTPEGKLDAVVEVAARQTTSCTFGSDNLGTLFITTSAQDLANPEPGAGAIFSIDPGVGGRPAFEYAG
jgi:sugar lactone lactonase YvrE